MSSYLIYGLGSMGMRRAQLLYEIDHAAEVYIHEPGAVALAASDSTFHVLEHEWDIPSGVTAAFVCSPPDQHLRQAFHLLSRGIPTLVEKPYCLMDELPVARRLFEHAWAAGTPTTPGHNLRFHPYVQRITDAVRSRELGLLQLHTARFGQHAEVGRPWASTPAYLTDPALGGGALQECLQDIDLYVGWTHAAQWSSGPDWGNVAATATTRRATGAHDDAVAVLHVHTRLPESVMVFDQLRHERLRYHELVGSHGTITWNQIGEREALRLVDGQGDVMVDLRGGPELMRESFAAETRAFLDGRRPLAPFAAMELLHGALNRMQEATRNA